jgi:hypothetical protein
MRANGFTETIVTFSKRLTALALIAGIGSMLLLFPTGAVAENTQRADAAEHDGQHDFDFNFGVWNTHIKRLTHPLSGSSDYIELNGIVTVRKVWAS